MQVNSISNGHSPNFGAAFVSRTSAKACKSWLIDNFMPRISQDAIEKAEKYGFDMLISADEVKIQGKQAVPGRIAIDLYDKSNRAFYDCDLSMSNSSKSVLKRGLTQLPDRLDSRISEILNGKIHPEM